MAVKERQKAAGEQGSGREHDQQCDESRCTEAKEESGGLLDSSATHFFRGTDGHDVFHCLEGDIYRPDDVLGGAHSAGGLRSGNTCANEHCALVDQPLQLICDSEIDGERRECGATRREISARLLRRPFSSCT